VHELGAHVRASVAAQLHVLPSEAAVFVNLHPGDLLDESLFEARAPLTPHARRVVLEITERATLDDVPDLGDRVARLRALGYRIALDDLGAGYAGLTTMAWLHPEIVKLDMSLVRGVHLDSVRRKMIQMVTTLTHEMGGVVVGEGIEQLAERAALSEIGCDLHQGYLLGRPGPPDALRTTPAHLG
jgi:EAL domain-containing protein (putative c-di-GMP-specific phosphodiesterase class I)